MSSTSESDVHMLLIYQFSVGFGRVDRVRGLFHFVMWISVEPDQEYVVGRTRCVHDQVNENRPMVSSSVDSIIAGHARIEEAQTSFDQTLTLASSFLDAKLFGASIY